MAGVVEELASGFFDALAGDHRGQEEFERLLLEEALVGVDGQGGGLGEG